MDIATLFSAAAAGLLSFFSPCILPLLPVYIGVLTTGIARDSGTAPSDDAASATQTGAGSGDSRPPAAARVALSPARQAANTIAFVLGISCVFVGLGIGAATLGSVASNVYVNIVLGLVVFVFGLYLAGFLRIPALQREHRADLSKIHVRSVAGAFLLGLAFSFGWTPCVGPILGSILALAAQQGSTLQGAVLLLVYALGLCVPFVVITLASSALLARLRRLYKYLPTIQRIGGILIAAMGIWMIVSQAPALTATNTTAQSESSSSSATVADVQGVHSGEEDVSDKSTAWKNVVLTDLNGKEHRLSEYKGEPLYFEFWGSWCESCVSDLGQLTEVYNEHHKKGDVRVVSVVVPGFYGEKNADDFVAWAKENNVTIPVLMDTNGSLSSYLGVTGFPTSVFVDSKGNLSKIRVGAMDKEELEKMLGDLN